MVRKLLSVFVMVTVAAFLGVVAAHAGDHPEHPTSAGDHSKHSTTDAKPAPSPEKPVVAAAAAKLPKLSQGQSLITGTVRCPACDLKKKGAASQCSVYGCSYSLKVKKVTDHKGKIVNGHSGKTYSLLANDKSSPLLQEKYKGKDVDIVGRIYPDENVLEIEFVKLAAK